MFSRKGRPRRCLSCGGLIGADSDRCSDCGARDLPWSGLLAHPSRLLGDLPVSYLLLGAIVLVHAAGILVESSAPGATGRIASPMSGFRPEVLLLLGIQENHLVAQGETWRLISSFFLHIGLLHIAFNASWLIFLGPSLEELFGKEGFLGIYVISGLTAAGASFLFVSAPTAGASGAVFSLLGALLAHSLGGKSWVKKETFRKALLWSGIGLAFGLLVPRTNNVAHVAGLLAGLALGLLIKPGIRGQSRKRAIAAGMAWCALALLAYGFGGLLLKAAGG